MLSGIIVFNTLILERKIVIFKAVNDTFTDSSQLNSICKCKADDMSPKMIKSNYVFLFKINLFQQNSEEPDEMAQWHFIWTLQLARGLILMRLWQAKNRNVM